MTLFCSAACGQVHLPKAPARFSERILRKYQNYASGGFSPYWVAYIVEPARGAADQSIFVELNGKRLGPYEQVILGCFVRSDAGLHREKGRFGVYAHRGQNRRPLSGDRKRAALPPRSRHYAYIVTTDKGQQLVIDGAVSPHPHTAIYRPHFNDADGSLDHLAVKEGTW